MTKTDKIFKILGLYPGAYKLEYKEIQLLLGELDNQKTDYTTVIHGRTQDYKNLESIPKNKDFLLDQEKGEL